MKTSPEPATVRDIRLGRNVYFDAWLYSMLMDNNLAYQMNPDIIASPEQLAFMVHLGEHQVYLPCSDATFAMLRAKTLPRPQGAIQSSLADYRAPDPLSGA